MLVYVKGKYLSERFYEREYTVNNQVKKDSGYAVSVFLGKENIEIFGCPEQNKKFGDLIEIPCDVFPTKNASLFFKFRRKEDIPSL